MRKTALLALLAMGVVILAAPAAFSATAPGKPVLTVDDCAKCHEGPPADIAAAGGKHKTEVGCLDCHAGHPPAVKDNVPSCGDCHDGAKHYELKGCGDCHKNPHKPLNIVLGPKVTDPCLTCHSDQIKQLKENPSKHTTLFCSACHDVHRKIPECTQCHKPHGTEMTKADCAKCHAAHKPMVLAYGKDVPNKDCAPCHTQAMKLLSGTATKHKIVSCASCHKEKHRMVPDCQMCHPKPHPENIVKKFPKCGMCHYIAHDLNNWPETPVKPAPVPPKKP